MRAGDAPASPAPALAQAAQDVGRAGLEAGREAWGVVTAFRRLVAADLTLSRVAFGTALAWTAGAVVLGASGWIFFMAAAVLGLQKTGLSLIASLLVPAVVSALGAGTCAWMGMRVYEHTSMDATRRQLARLGLAGDPAQDSNPETGVDPAASERPPEPEPKAPPPEPVEPLR